MRTSPLPPFQEPPKRDYNLRWGPVTGRIFGSLQTEFSDNINLSENNAEADAFFFPNAGIGFQWPLSPRNILEFSLGFGYRAYIDHPELNTFLITPDSKLLYQMRAGKVNITFRDAAVLQVDPLSRPDISASSAPGLLNFRRINNDTSVQAEYSPRSNLTLVSSYDYVLDRSLNSQFTSLDRDDHGFGVGAYSNFGSAWNVGINGAATITDFVEPVQNDAISFSTGPTVSVKVSRFITVEGSVSYTVSDFDQSGTILDHSDFSGISFGVGVRHNVNSRLFHSVRVARSISPGFLNNFNDLTVLQYGVNWRLNSFITLNSMFTYEHFDASGAGGESADRFLWYLGSGWQIARHWNLGLGYSFARKDSDQPLRGYQQNRATLDVTYHF